jgi:ATP-binding cassette subfamily C protein LapB
MDPSAEQALLARLKPALAGRTVVLVTHKPSMLELVDKVIVMDAGRVVAFGPKDLVMRPSPAPHGSAGRVAPLRQPPQGLQPGSNPAQQAPRQDPAPDSTQEAA